MEQKITYLFGPFRLITENQLLRHADESISLPPKIYRLLLYFLEHPGRLISRKELFDAVWQDTIVEDTALRLAVNALRKALHDDSKTPQFILTACKRGYRFLPEVNIEHSSRGNFKTDQPNGIYYRPKSGLHITQQFKAEQEQLLEAFEQATDGRRQVVFLKGDRSMGKTALLERFLARINHPEHAYLRARCVPLNGTAEPFLPLLEALERRCQEPCGKPIIHLLHHIAPTWFQQIANVLEPEEFGTYRPNFRKIGSTHMLREGANFFEKLGTESTFILILDNSHWSDRFTLDLLNFLMSRSSTTKLLMILSFRPRENNAGARRLECMRKELAYRGLCRELSLQRPAGQA